MSASMLFATVVTATAAPALKETPILAEHHVVPAQSAHPSRIKLHPSEKVHAHAKDQMGPAENVHLNSLGPTEIGTSEAHSHANDVLSSTKNAHRNQMSQGHTKLAPSGETHGHAKDQMGPAKSAHRNPLGQGHSKLDREVQIGQNGRIPSSQHMTLAQRWKHDSDTINSLLEAARGNGSRHAALVQDGNETSSQPSGWVEMPEEMVDQEEELTMPEAGTNAEHGVAMLQSGDKLRRLLDATEEDNAVIEENGQDARADQSEKVQDARADQGTAMLQQADQIIQTDGLFEEDGSIDQDNVALSNVPLSQFKETRPCLDGTCRPEARQWWELLGNYY